MEEAEAVDAPLARPHPFAPEDFDVIWSFLEASDLFAVVRRLYASRGWAWQELTPQQLRQRLEQGKVWGVRDGDEVTALAIVSRPEGGENALWPGYVDGAVAPLTGLLRELRRLAYAQDRAKVRGHFPLRDPVLQALEAAGYRRAWEPEVWVYERRYGR